MRVITSLVSERKRGTDFVFQFFTTRYYFLFYGVQLPTIHYVHYTMTNVSKTIDTVDYFINYQVKSPKVAGWLYLYTWYSSLLGVVKWNNSYSSEFRIIRGTRQGSIFSPILFNVFVNYFIVVLKHTTCGILIGNERINSFDYAKDITQIATMICGLQCLIDICNDYTKLSIFNFGQNKSKCMAVGRRDIFVNSLNQNGYFTTGCFFFRQWFV